MSRLAIEAGKLWARLRPEPPPGSSRAPDCVVSALEMALGRQAHRIATRRRLIRATSFAAAAAALLVVGWTLWRPPSSGQRMAMTPRAPGEPRANRALTVLKGDGARVTSDRDLGPGAAVADGNARPATRGMMLQPGLLLVAPDSEEVRVGNDDGTTLTLERASQLMVVEQAASRQFKLRQGAVRAQVAKLRGGERFIIATDDAEVEVHGTVFRVATVAANPACGGGTRTRVSVFEGVVSVRAAGGESFVPSGGVWPAGCPVEGQAQAAGAAAAGGLGARPAASVAAGSPSRARLGRRDRPSARSGADADAVSTHGPRPSTSAPAAPSTEPASGEGAAASVAADGATAVPALATSNLSAANDLFAAAVRARRQHHTGDAVRLLSRLIDSYPGSPLFEAAMAQRMRLLGLSDPAAGARAASEYLARFPAGFAREEARRLAVPPS